MSFDVVCPGCGAPSGPSVGTCPFCKATLVSSQGKKGKENATITAIRKYFGDGRMDRALVMANAAYESKPALLENAGFLVLYAKILIESDGPKSKIHSVLTKATLADPEHPEVLEYLEIADALALLKRDRRDDQGELILKNLIRRSPKNAHALFILGSHLAWDEGEVQEPIRYLVQCVRVRPNYLRAWGCLGALYKKIGNAPLAAEAFRRAMKLETNPAMRAHMEKMIPPTPARRRG